MRIGVTGATGRIGGGVARSLAAQGVPLRLLVRDAARAPALPDAEVAVASYADSDAVRRAVDGIDLLLMVSAAEAEDRLAQHLAFLDGAEEVAHVVYLSFVGAGPAATFTLARDHGATEDRLRARAGTWTSLRDNLYADFLPGMVGSDDVVRGPAGNGRAAVVAQEDVVDAAVAVLLDPAPHAGQVHELTGPEAVSFAEVAELLGERLGRPVRYEDETVEQAYASRASYGAPQWQLDAWVSTYLAVADGSLSRVTDDVERLTGHLARPLRQVLGL
jgi:NAD(P)H dehydrogenase (quinone)